MCARARPRRVHRGGRPGPQLGAMGPRRRDRHAQPHRRRGPAACRRRRSSSGRAFALGLPLSEAEGIQLGFVEGRVNPTRTMVQVNHPVNADRPRLGLLQRGRPHPGHPVRHPLGRPRPQQLRRGDLQRLPGVDRLGRRRRPLRHPPARAPWSAAASCSTWPAPSGARCSSRATPSCPDDLDAACELAQVTRRAGRHRAGAHRPDGASRARSVATWSPTRGRHPG